MTGSRTDPERTARTLALVLTIAGVVTIVVGVVLGAIVTPLLYLIALSAIFDFALAYAYATGRIGTGDQVTATPEGPQAAGEDPSYNPYARED
jgi:hypothetical protein